MASNRWDNSPPQNLIILACAVGSALLLFTLKFGFDAYYDGMMDRHVTERQTQYDDLAAVHARRGEWQAALARGNRMSITRAMEQLGERGRSADPAIAPQRPAEMNTGPLEGWNQLPQEVVIPEPAPAPAAAQPTRLSPEALQQLQEALQRLVQQPPEGGQ